MRPPADVGWVLYDGDYASCVRWPHFWKPVLHRLGSRLTATGRLGGPGAANVPKGGRARHKAAHERGYQLRRRRCLYVCRAQTISTCPCQFKRPRHAPVHIDKADRVRLRRG